MPTSLRSSPSGKSYALEASLSDYGSQISWAIDPLTGDDENPGTPAAPLRTMREFSARMLGLHLTVASTLQLVGNVTDSALQLSGTRFAAGASLTVSGTLTDLGTGIVTGSVTVGNSGWTLTTTGIDWTTIPVNSLLRFSTGHVGNIAEIVDANNVIIGLVGLPGTAIPSAAPTNGSTVTASSRSRTPIPQINALGQSIANANQVILQQLSFDIGNTGGALTLSGGIRVQFYGCEINNQNTLSTATGFNVRCCRFTITNTMSWQTASPIAQTIGCVVAGTGATLFNHQSGTTIHSNLLMTGARLTMNGGGTNVQISTGHIRNTAGPVSVTGGASLNLISVLSGTTGNTGIGIDVPYGFVSYFGAGAKPTVAGTNDTRVGGSLKTYANIPFTALDATAPTNVTGTGSRIVQE